VYTRSVNYYLAFSLSPFGSRRFSHMLSYFGNVEKIWGADAESLRQFEIGEKTYARFDNFRSKYNSQFEEKKLEKLSIKFVSQIDSLYPQELFELIDPPIGIFVKGDVGVLGQKPSIGVVGTRKMTIYGKRVTENIVGGLVRRGFSIVSGLALGVDACAHFTCVRNNGIAIAVLGTGVERAYPRENEGLYEQILDLGGCVISEYPAGMPATKGSFPARNRIIAALSQRLLVTEAGDGSGSLITAKISQNLGRKVYAVPGQVGTYGAKGVNQLLRDGGSLVESADDIAEREGMTATSFSLDMSKFSELEQKVLQALFKEELEADELLRQLECSSVDLLRALSILEIRGLIAREGTILRVKNT